MCNKYKDLKTKYESILKENKLLKTKYHKKEVTFNSTGPSEKESDTTDEEALAKSRSMGFRRTTPQEKPEKKISCPVCNMTFRRENALNDHMARHNKDGDWLCGDCSYQTNNEANLSEHKLKAHSTPISPSRDQIKHGVPGGGNRDSTCNMCNKDFIYRVDLTKHIRDEHKTYKQCKNLKTCTYTPKCRYNHKEYPPGTQICFECGKTFKTVHDLMRHRKSAHKVQLCKEFLKGSCGYSQQDCYYTHANQACPEPAQIVENNSAQNEPQPQGFWKAPSNLAPPSSSTQASSQGPTQAEWIVMKQTLSHLNQMMAKFL